MQSFSQKFSPAWPLRIGFAAMYLYSSQSIFFTPEEWTWAIPKWFTALVENFVSIETFLRVQALTEFTIALVFLAWFLKPQLVKYFALVSIMEMAGILALSPPSSFPVTFRDLGLLGGSLALFLLLQKEELLNSEL